MRELSLHILDIAQNSVSANAKNIEIEITEKETDNLYNIIIRDDGKGMDEETLNRINHTFATSRTTRKVGMGIALFRAAAEMAGGNMVINSELGKGTIINATFKRDNIDRMPLGDIAETIVALIIKNKDIEYTYRHTFNDKEFIFSTSKIKEIIEDIPIDSLEILQFIKNYINENLKDLGVV